LIFYRLIFIFIPHHHIGGAERVHLNIIKALPYKPIVFFDFSNTKLIDKGFSENAYCFRLTSSRRRKYAYWFLWFITSFFSVTVFGSNSALFYGFLSRLKKKVRSIDLTHAFSFPDTGMEITSLPYIDLLDKRIVINSKTYEDYKQLYSEKKINQALLKRFTIISNGTEIKDFDKSKIDSRFSNFTIGFVGRNSPEKRPEIFFEIVKRLKIKAKVIGDDFTLYKNDFPSVIYFENCNDKELVREQFSEIALLVVTSSREGFPLVIMEAMELGIPVISSNVGSISEHVRNDINGFLINATVQSEFLNLAIQKIRYLAENKDKYCELSSNSRQYACEHFDNLIFEQKYRELFYE
jgi:glycosyltransferase involved in cell wall biosynthesis